MPAIKGAKQTKADIAALKEKYLWYYRDCPIQKYAAQSIRRDMDTIIRWRDEDPGFAEAIKEAESEFVRKNLLKTKADWRLERILKSEFAQRTELTGADGEKLEGLVVIKTEGGSTP